MRREEWWYNEIAALERQVRVVKEMEGIVEAALDLKPGRQRDLSCGLWLASRLVARLEGYSLSPLPLLVLSAAVGWL